MIAVLRSRFRRLHVLALGLGLALLFLPHPVRAADDLGTAAARAREIANRLQAALDPDQQGRVTMAAAILEGGTVVIATSEKGTFLRSPVKDIQRELGAEVADGPAGCAERKIIAYVRSIPSIDNPVPDSKANFPVNIIMNTMPQPAQHQARPDKSDILAYGAYMTNASGCVECHTQIDKGVIIKEVSFAGGREFGFPDGSVLRSSNLTSDKQTGIGQWTEEMFVQKFKVYADSSYVPPQVGPGEFNSIMPWTMYGQMETDDLKAIYAYLKTVAPISNKVVKFTPGSVQ